MKRNKKGFTLIELLAVIVILAIIALIAVPVVMNIITKSQKSVFKDTAYGIIKAGELYYADRLFEPDGMAEAKIFTFPNDVSGLDIKGSKPTDGRLIITKEGKIAIGITDGKYCATKGYEDSDVVVTEGVDNCEFPTLTLFQLATTGTFSKVNGTEVTEITEVNECATDKTEGACAPGTEFVIKVNEKDIYRFFVLNDSGSKVTLIMDRNLDKSAWHANVGDGPITALTVLQNRTSTWTNLPKMTIDTFDYDDGRDEVALGNNQTFNMHARLPKYNELYVINNSSDLTTTPWLYINLSGTGGTSAAYWTSTAYGIRGGAHYVHQTGVMDNWNVYSIGHVYGVRPVIELFK